MIAGQHLDEFCVLTTHGIGWIIDHTLVKRVM